MKPTTKKVFNQFILVGVPDSLKKKIDQIKANGGKDKLDLEIKIIKTNSQQVGSRFNELKQQLHEEEVFDNNKRSQYGNKWNRPPSNVVNRSYLNQIESSF